MLANVIAQLVVLRIDLTEDRRHTLSSDTRQLACQFSETMQVTVWLRGDVNSGFTTLSTAVKRLLRELDAYGNIQHEFRDPSALTAVELEALQKQLLMHNLHPTAVYESNTQGSTTETLVYPFAQLHYQGREQWVSLLQNRRDLSGAENINQSISSLEYRFALAMSSLLRSERGKVAFLEGHGELPEPNTKDVEMALSEHFDVYRGSVTTDADCLDGFSAVIVADPQLPFSEADKYVIDHYLMQGGSMLWLLNGVRFSEQVLQDEGYTPALALDLNLTDLLFRYGIRVNNRLLQDMQCLPVPVDVSRNPEQPQYQPMPWHYAPLLFTSSLSPVTSNLSPVSAPFCSDLTAVGDTLAIRHTVLLATSEMSAAIPVPAEVNLSDLNADPRLFTLAHLPVAMSLEGEFSSLYAHRMIPEGITVSDSEKPLSGKAKQIVVGAGSIIRNDLQQGKPLPAGYDRYSRTQFANRDFIVNAVLWLSDDSHLLRLRQKTVRLRMLQTQAYDSNKAAVLCAVIMLPLLLLALTGIAVTQTRKRRYAA